MAILPLTAYHWAQHMATVVEFIGSFHAAILLIYHIYFISSTSKKQKHPISFIHYSSIFYFLSVLPYCVGVLLLSFGIKTTLGCKYFVDLVGVAIFIAKCICFIVFVEKLNITFSGTMYAFKPTTIKIWKIILFVWMLILIALVFISGDGYYVEEHNLCAGSYPLYAHGIAVLGDFIIGLTISTTFCRRLLKLQITLQNVNPNDSDMDSVIKNTQEMRNLMTKFTVLATFSIFTTLFTYIVIFIFELGSFWMIIDTMINSWCIICLFEGNTKIYKFLCGPTEKCCIASHILTCCSCRCCCMITPTEIKISDNEQEQNQNDKDSPASEDVYTNSVEITTQNKAMDNMENKASDNMEIVV